MQSSQVADELRKLLKNELEDCGKAFATNDLAKAKRAFDEAIEKLQRLIRDI